MRVATYYDITVCDDVVRGDHWDITMGYDLIRDLDSDAVYITNHVITILNDVVMNLFYCVLFAYLCYFIMGSLK